MMLGIALGLYKTKSMPLKLIQIIATFRAWDEITLDDGVINYIDAIEVVIIYFMLKYHNEKNYSI